MRRIGVREAIQAPSFAQALRNLREVIGAAPSSTSLWEWSQASGEAVRRVQQQEAEQVMALPEVGSRPGEHSLPLLNPIRERGNVSTDGGKVRIREQGWREVKVSVFSQVERASTAAENKKTGDERPKVRLREHSYVALVTDADTFAGYQFAEGLRRGVEQVPLLSSVNDGAPWIVRITQTNFPHAHLVLDWYHASSHLYTVADEAWPAKDDAQRRAWLCTQQKRMEQGNIQALIQSVSDLAPQAPTTALNTAAYFQERQDYMQYDHYRQLGLPIGSGTVESAIINVIQRRMHRPGRGWSASSVNGFLSLLCAYHSNRFDALWAQAVSPSRAH